MNSARKNIPDPFEASALKNPGGATLQDTAKFIQTRKVSPVEVVNACLQRIEDLNPKLNAFINVLADQAEAAKAEIKAGKRRGPLHGIPVGIKDFYDTAGIRTTAGFEHFKDRVPAKDAVGARKLKEAGAIMIGKTNMHQLGMGTTGLESYFGPVNNPWNPEYIRGGSSSGSAAAVASGYLTLPLPPAVFKTPRLCLMCLHNEPRTEKQLTLPVNSPEIGSYELVWQTTPRSTRSKLPYV